MSDTSQQAPRPLKDAAMLPNPRRSPRGRKSIYKPEYCELVETWGKQGKSKAEMCSLLNIGRATMHGWEQEHGDFAASLARAREHAQAWWEGKAQKSLGRKHFQAQLWRYSMAGRFKEDYAEQRVDIAQGFGDWMAAVLEIANKRKPALAAPGDEAKPVDAQVIEEKGKTGT